MAATFNVMIRVDPSSGITGARRVEDALDRTRSKAMQLNSTLRNLFGIFALKEVIKFFYGLVDGYTSLQNKLRVVTKDQANLTAVTEETYQIAQRTRTSWEATAQMYSRVALNSRELGLSQRRLLGFTELLNKAVIVSGATSTESAAALVQLSQGMASGALRGDELRSVLEQLPYVADILAKKLGITRGELRDFGKAGKITSKTIIEAFEASRNEIEEKFGKTIPTIAQSFVMLKNAAMKFFGETATGSGSLSSLSRAIAHVSENFEIFGKIIISLAEFIGVILAVKAIGKLISMLRALAIAANAHPLIAILTAITALVIVIRQFGDEWNSSVEVVSKGQHVFASWLDRLRALWEMIKELGASIYEFVQGAWQSLTAAFSDGVNSEGIEWSLRNILIFIASFVDAAISIFKGLKDTILTVFGGIPVVIVEVFSQMIRDILSAIQGLLNQIIGVYNKVRGTLFDFFNNTVERKRKAVNEAYNIPPQQYKQDAETAQREAETKFPTNYRVDRLDPKTNKVIPDPNYNILMDPEIIRKTREEYIKARMKEFEKVRMTAAYERQGLDETGQDPRSQQIAPVDLSFQGPEWANGALQHLGDKLGSIWGKEFGSTAAIDGVNSFMDAWDEKTKRIALERLGKPKLEGGVGSDEGKDISKPPEDKAGKKARDHLTKELEQLMKRSNPITEAQIKIANASDILQRSVVQGIKTYDDETITLERAIQVLRDYEKALDEALHPYEFRIAEIEKETAAMKGSREETELAQKVLEEQNKLMEKGLTIEEEHIKGLTKSLKLQQDRARVWKIEQDMLDEIYGPWKKYQDQLAAINSLLEQNKISQQNAADARGKAAKEFSATKDAAYEDFQKREEQKNKFTYGVKEGFRQIAEEMTNLSATVSNEMMNMFSATESAIKNMVETGKMEWDDLAKSIISSLNKIAMKILETWLMTKLLNIAGYGSGSGLVGVVNTVTGGDSSDLAYGGAYATGGDYVVPGSGGPDSQRVVFDLSPREHVRITPPGKDPNKSEKSGPTVVHTHVHNHYDKNSLVPALKTARGKQEILNVLRDNPGAVRSAIQKG